MRKALLLTLCIGSCLLLAACGAEPVAPSPAPVAAPTEEAAMSRAEHWREMDLAFDPAPSDIPEAWECRQPVYALREDGTEYGKFVWFDETGNTRREATYLGDLCTEQADYDADRRLTRLTFTRVADGSVWRCVRSFEEGRIVTRYALDGVPQRTWTQYQGETGADCGRAEMRGADGNLLFTRETVSAEGRTTEVVTVPDCALTVRTENNAEVFVNDVLVSTRRNGALADGAEAALRKYTDRSTGNRRWVVLKDGETWMEIFWAAEPLGHGDLLDAYDISVRFGEPEPVAVAESAERTDEWQARIPLTDGELHFKDYAAVYAQLSDSEREQPWSEKPYEAEGLGFLSGEELFDDPEAALNVHPEGWRVPDGGSMTESVPRLVGLVQCTLPTAQQTNVLPGEIVEPWTLLDYRWTDRDGESGTGRSVTVSVKPGAFDYDPDPNRSEGFGYDVGRYDLNDPGTAAHVFVGDMDSRIGRARLAIRTEGGRCHASMVLDDTGYWVDAVGLTQEEVTALLLSIVNASPESGLRVRIRESLREAAEAVCG